MATTRADDPADTVLDQIRQLRADVEKIARERVAPAVAEMAGNIGDAANDRADAVIDAVRKHPVQAVLIAAGIGFLVGRLTR